MATASKRGQNVRVWDLKSGLSVSEMKWDGKDNYISALAFSPDGGDILALSAEIRNNIMYGRLHRWNVTSGKVIAENSLDVPPPHNPNFNGKLTFSPNGAYCALIPVREWSNILIWETGTGKMVGNHPPGGGSFAFSPDGGTYLSALEVTQARREIRLFETETGKSISEQANFAP